LANVAIIAAAGATVLVSSTWWDVIVGLVIGYLNADAAVKVWKRSRTDLKLANAAV
jgi:Co/Zn/Cd efflux system component